MQRDGWSNIHFNLTLENSIYKQSNMQPTPLAFAATSVEGQKKGQTNHQFDHVWYETPLHGVTMLTENRGNLVWAEVVVGEIKYGPKFL